MKTQKIKFKFESGTSYIWTKIPEETVWRWHELAFSERHNSYEDDFTNNRLERLESQMYRRPFYKKLLRSVLHRDFWEFISFVSQAIIASCLLRLIYFS